MRTWAYGCGEERPSKMTPLPQLLVSELRGRKVEQAKQWIALGLGKDSFDLVFSRLDGEIRSPRAFTKEFSRAVKVAGLSGITFHGLRHTHITDLLRRGVHVKVVSERAGHANVAITLAIYGHVIPGMQESAAALVDESLSAALEE